jgi:hypothetical protein
MKTSVSRADGLEWFKSHASWEFVKWVVERFILLPAFAWLVSLGYARMIHAALGTAFNVFLILFGSIGLIWILGFVPKKNKSAQLQQAQQSAIDQISKLLTRGDYLVSQAPNAGVSTSDFCRFWNDQLQRWGQEVGSVLSDTWGTDAMHAFFSIRGLQLDQPAGRVHPEAASSYHQYNHWLKNLEHLKQTLPGAWRN